MFGISFTELLVVLLIAFLIVGPKKMTELAYDLGKWLGKIKAQLKHIKETQIDVFDDSTFYSPTVEMDKSLDEVDVPEKEKEKDKDKDKEKEPSP